MLEQFAQVIIDISARGLDRPFNYRVPPALEENLRAGSIVMVPFGAGNRLRKGYVVGFTDRVDVPPEKIKEIAEAVEPARGYSLEDNSEFYLRLAAWMKNRYGSTMATAMRTVLASRKAGKIREHRQIRLLILNGRPGDIIVLAGKGHEDYQEINGKKYPMDERVLIREILEEEGMNKH